jgi:prepilin-type N-terminal cleavage/methylation domain-containing protein
MSRVAGIRWRGRGGVTLVELMVSLVVLTIISTAVLYMLRAGAQLSGAMNSSISSETEIEAALARIVQQVRNCTSLNVPHGTSGDSSFSIVTEPDAANGNQTYSVTYQLSGSGAAQQLQEVDARYGTSTLVRNVQSFNVRTKSATGTQVIILTLTVGASPPVTRTVRITPRNQ